MIEIIAVGAPIGLIIGAIALGVAKIIRSLRFGDDFEHPALYGGAARDAVMQRKKARAKRNKAILLIATALGAIIAGATSDLQTHSGVAVGYVTAVETGGLFFSTTTVYFKTDLESTQEDEYCVADRTVIEQLRQAADNNTRLRLNFAEYWWWVEGCEFNDGTTIVSATVL